MTLVDIIFLAFFLAILLSMVLFSRTIRLILRETMCSPLIKSNIEIDGNEIHVTREPKHSQEQDKGKAPAQA